MADYDLLKAFFQEENNYQSQTKLDRMKALLDAANFPALKQEFELNVAFWKQVEPNLFDTNNLFIGPVDSTANAARAECKKSYDKNIFSQATQKVKTWLTQNNDLLLYAQHQDLLKHIDEYFNNNLTRGQGAFPDLLCDVNRLAIANPEENEKFKYYLKSQHLIQNIELEQFSDQTIEALANADSLESMQAVFNSDAFKHYSLDPKTLADETTFAAIASAALAQFIKKKISLTMNQTMLDALMQVKTRKDLAHFAKHYPEAGLGGLKPEVFQKLQNETAFIKEIQQAAIVSEKIHRASKFELDQIVHASTAAEFVSLFPAEAALNRLLIEHFNPPAGHANFNKKSKNQADARRLAVIKRVKIGLGELSEAALTGIIAKLKNLDARRNTLLQKPVLSALEKSQLARLEDQKKADVDGFISNIPKGSHKAIEKAIKVEALLKRANPELILNQIKQTPDFLKKEGIDFLSQREIKALELRLVEQVIESTPAYIDALISAKNLKNCEAVFKSDNKVTNLDWLDEKTFKSVQKSAHIFKIQSELEKLRPGEKNNHPALLELLRQLPLSQLQQILQEQALYLPFLINSTKEEALRDLLGAKNAAISIEDLRQENKSFKAKSQIANAAVAGMLTPIGGITKDQVNQINIWFENNPRPSKLDNIKLDAELSRIFGLRVSSPGLMIKIQEQFDRNADVYTYFLAKHKAMAIKLPHLFNYLLAMEKPGTITNVDIDKIITAIGSSYSMDELTGKIQPDALKNAFIKNLTPAAYQQLNAELFKYYLNHGNFNGARIDDDRSKFLKPLQDRLQLFNEAEAKTDEWFGQRQTVAYQLDKLRTMDFLSVHLSLEKASPEVFKFYQEKLQQLEAICDAAIPDLKDQLILLNKRKQTLETTVTSVEDMKLAYLAEIEAQIINVKTMLERHEKAKLALRGDPAEVNDKLRKKGAFQIMQETRTHQRILPENIFTDYKIVYGQYRNAERDAPELQNAAYQPARSAVVPTSVGTAVDATTMATQKKTSGSSNVIRVTKQTAAGEAEVAKFVEEPDSREAKLTIAKFPTVANPVDYIVASFAAAEAYLKKRENEGISPKTPIVINGANKDEVKGLYFALRTLLKKYPQGDLKASSVQISDSSIAQMNEDPRNFFGNVSLDEAVANSDAAQAKIREAVEGWGTIAKQSEMAKEFSAMPKKLDFKETLGEIKNETDKRQQSLQATPKLKTADEEEESASYRPSL